MSTPSRYGALGELPSRSALRKRRRRGRRGRRGGRGGRGGRRRAGGAPTTDAPLPARRAAVGGAPGLVVRETRVRRHALRVRVTCELGGIAARSFGDHVPLRRIAAGSSVRNAAEDRTGLTAGRARGAARDAPPRLGFETAGLAECVAELDD